MRFKITTLLFLVGIALSITAFSQPAIKPIPFKLKVSTSSGVQRNATKDMRVVLFKDKKIIYEEVHKNLKTSKLGIANVKIGGGKPEPDYDFSTLSLSIQDRDKLGVAYQYGGEDVNGGKKSKLKMIAYAITAGQTQFVDTLFSSTRDSVFVKNDLNLNSNELINVGAFVPDFIRADSVLMLPVTDQAGLDDPDRHKPQIGEIIFLEETLKDGKKNGEIMLYNGKRWIPIVDGVGGSEQKKEDKAEKSLSLNTGNIYMKTDDLSKLNLKIKPTLKGVGGRMYVRLSNNTDFTVEHSRSQKSGQDIGLKALNYGSTMIHIYSAQDPHLHASIVVFIEEKSDPDTDDKFVFPSVKTTSGRHYMPDSVDNYVDTLFIDDPYFLAENPSYTVVTQSRAAYAPKKLTGPKYANHFEIELKYPSFGWAQYHVLDEKGRIVAFLDYGVQKTAYNLQPVLADNKARSPNFLFTNTNYEFTTLGGDDVYWFSAQASAGLGLPSPPPTTKTESKVFRFSTKGAYRVFANTAIKAGLNTIGITNVRVVDTTYTKGTASVGSAPYIADVSFKYDTAYFANVEWRVSGKALLSNIKKQSVTVQVYVGGKTAIVPFDKDRNRAMDTIYFTPAGFKSGEKILDATIVSENRKSFYSPAKHKNAPIKFYSVEEKKLNNSNFVWSVEPNSGFTSTEADEVLSLKFNKAGKYSVQRYDDVNKVVVDSYDLTVYMK